MRSRYVDVEDRTQDLAQLIREESAFAQDFLRKYELSWVYHENALEGVVFTGLELETALAQKPLAEVGTIAAFRDIRNTKASMDVIRSEAAQKKPKVTLPLIQKLYATIHAGIESRAGGEFRRDIPLHRSYFHEISPPARIVAQLAKLLEWCDSPEFRSAHPVHTASKLQHGFMQVYPYTEGSGKIARLLGNMVLIHAGYQPCIIHTIDRQRYYESLKQAEPALRELMMESLENGLANAEKYFRQALASRAKAAARRGA